MSRHAKGKYPNRSVRRLNSVFLIWITANRRSWTAFGHPSPNVGIGTPLMNSFSGTAPSHDFRSTGLLLPAIAYSLRIDSLRGERSMGDSPLYGGSPMKPRTPACSVRNSLLASDV